ncbi:MAG: hypothetical protein AB1546_00275 [bacterium]
MGIIFQDVFRTVVTFFLLFLVIYMFILSRSIVSELRSVIGELREVIRVLKEIRDYQKGIMRKKVRKE